MTLPGQRISASTITAAILAGADDVQKIAKALGVKHANYTLRSTLTAMLDTGFLGRTDDGRRVGSYADRRILWKLHLTDPTAYPDDAAIEWQRHGQYEQRDPQEAAGEPTGVAPTGAAGEFTPDPKICGSTDYLTPHEFVPNDHRPNQDGYYEWEFCEKAATHPIHRVAGTGATAREGRAPGDTLDVEQLVRDKYAELCAAGTTYLGLRERGSAVRLADLRAALPPGLDRRTVDAALERLAACADVHVYPRADQRRVAPADRDASLWMGNQHNHVLRIEPHVDATSVFERLNMASRDDAMSMVAPLDERTLAAVAEQMGVDGDGNPAEVRARLVLAAEANSRAWLGKATAEAAAGSLLYRADTDADWVAHWTPEDRAAVADAAAMLLDRSQTDDSWGYVQARAQRWAAATRTGRRTQPTPEIDRPTFLDGDVGELPPLPGD